VHGVDNFNRRIDDEFRIHHSAPFLVVLT